MIEINIALQEKQRQFRAALEKYPVVGFGGARGGGKSYALRNIFLLRRFQYPGSVGAIFRRTFPELYANHIQPLFREHPYLRPYWNESKKILSLPNGSSLQFCHCAGEGDVALHQGKEWADLGFDEAGQLSESIMRTLQGSNRCSIPGVPVRMACTMNPGGPNHAFLKRIFIDRRFNERERPGDYFFIQSLIKDNAVLILNDPDYIHRLEAEPNEALRRAYLYGDWSIHAGQYFTELRRETHFIQPFDIPKHWIRFGAYDFGFNHAAAFGWFAVSEDGEVYLYRELVQAGVHVDQFAERIKAYEDTEKLEYIVAGWDCWAQKGTLKAGSPPTIAEEFMNHGIHLSRATIDRLQGAAQVRGYIGRAEAKESGRPRFFIFNTCPISYECLTRMEHDPKRLEDVLKVDATAGDPMTGDDPYDMIRMGLMSRPGVSEAPMVRHKPGTEAYGREQVKLMEEEALRQYQKAMDIEKGLTFADDPWAQNPPEFDNDI